MDLSSLELYGNVVFTQTANAGPTSFDNAPATACKYPSTNDLIDSMRIMTGGGEVIENLADISTYAEILTRGSGSKTYLDSTAAILSNAHSLDTARDPCTGAGKRFKFGITHYSGFLNCGKYILPAALGNGIVLELTLKSNDRAFAVRGTAGQDAFSYALSNVNLRYDTVEVSESYEKMFSVLFQRGFSIVFPTYSVSTSQTSSLTNVSHRLTKQARKVKDIVTVVRPVLGLSSSLYDDRYFIGGSTFDYQYRIGGKCYPSAPVSEHSHAYQNFLKSSYNHQNSNHSPVITPGSWQYASPLDLTIPDAAAAPEGHFCMTSDLEQVQGDLLSGTTLSSAGDSLNFSMGGVLHTGEFEVSSFITHDRILSISPSNIAVLD